MSEPRENTGNWSDIRKVIFWSRVSIGEPNDCWYWTGLKFENGYGAFRLGRRMLKAHRCAYELSHGVLPGNLRVLHSCDHPACCNPAHLRLGTMADNIKDRDNRGRGKPAPQNLIHRLGEDNQNAKLCSGQVLEIKALLQAGHLTHAEIGKIYGVGRTAISLIANGKTWKTI